MLFCNIDLLDENFECKRGQYVGVKDGKIAYIGDADIVAEGEAVTIEKMTTSTRKATVKKAMKGIGLTDEAVLSGYGNPVGEANTQLAQAIAAKVDNDCMDALQTASLIYDGSQAQISYNAIVDAVDLFEEEMGCSDKVLFIHPKQEIKHSVHFQFRTFFLKFSDLWAIHGQQSIFPPKLWKALNTRFRRHKQIKSRKTAGRPIHKRKQQFSISIYFFHIHSADRCILCTYYS